MADYRRLVSYIYLYPGGVRDRNVGFAKAEVRNGQFKLAVSLKGVYTDTPELFGVYFMVDGEKHKPGGFTLLKIGTVMVNQGIGQYQDIFNPSNLNQSGYTFDEISGIALARGNDSFYMMFSLWQDCALDPAEVVFAKEGYQKELQAQTDAAETQDTQAEESKMEQTQEEQESKELVQQQETHLEEKHAAEAQATEELQQPEIQEVQEPPEDDTESEGAYAQAASVETQVRSQAVSAEEMPQVCVAERIFDALAKPSANSAFDQVFENADFIDAFDDDYYYDCVEVSPETLKKLPIEDEAVVNNSFLVHGFFNFKHILFGKVRENDNNTKYFIGVPGMYCNRERFMASMFGFNNFKKSHRSDFTNPYFGYWYQEI